MKKLIAIAALLFLIGVASHGLNWLSIPGMARLPSLEETYGDQISRLQYIAYDHESRWNTSPEMCDSDRELFNLPEILRASVEPSLRSHLIVGNREFKKQSEFSLIESDGAIGVVRKWYTKPDGSKIAAVKMRKLVRDAKRNEVFVNLTIDLNKMNPNLESSPR